VSADAVTAKFNAPTAHQQFSMNSDELHELLLLLLPSLP
jgi:hypothetical protein